MVQQDARRKKDLGAFYTHKALSDLICAWAIQTPQSTVLEPSFGGCGFLRSALDRLTSFNANASLSQLYGCDIDPLAFSHLSTVFEQLVDLDRFHEGDFLDQSFPSSWPSAFDSVVGNPPYLPYRKLRVARREAVLSQLQSSGLELDRRASLWAYFVALGVLYTAEGGRNAWVLPSSFLYANYSTSLRLFLSANFEDCCAFELKERQFLLEGTEEKSIVLLCKSKTIIQDTRQKRDIPLIQCNGVKDVELAIKEWEQRKKPYVSFCGTSVYDSLSKGPKGVIQKLQKESCLRSLGDFLSIRIGIVTGNNRFFLLGEDDRKAANLAEGELDRILPRFHFAPGLSYESADHENLLSGGGKGFLVSVKDQRSVSQAMSNYLARYPVADVETCSTFKKRSIWSHTNDGSIPDAFFPVMQHHGPRLILNESVMNCTNSIHRAYFNDKLSKTEQKLLSLSLLSTFSQISAEICGRSYGSGALKHEPREAEKIHVLMPRIHPKTVSAAFCRVDRLLRNGNLSEARQFVDLLLLDTLKVDDVHTDAALLESGLTQLKAHRHR
ncbi:N-6 DNA methylase [Puniceibacterium sp. IMCC21224]|uniref:N-6 DNA methylase n=1 Tax=Puniceibacterium sp. IMCC21224 TaxID=1618204 RepID=UPI00064DDF9B|nr:N-6 DNA methylase [Puniceibacterium sp. IMCC21224]KMK63908.1 N-6 DNA Methylase [Puniceibacterium sp. IMCC21224]